MIIFDAHNDTITQIRHTKENLFENTGHIDFKRLLQKKPHKFILCCAMFIRGNDEYEVFCKTDTLIDELNCELKSYSDFALLNDGSKDITLILSLEGGEALCGETKNVEYFHNKGVRAISLTWNTSNGLSGGCEDSNLGLTEKGRNILAKMQELDIILDLSHISDKAFFETFEYFSGKIIASHSNARSVCNHRRNLTNTQIELLKLNGGVIGINLYSDFLEKNAKAGMKDVLNHIEHIAGFAGTETVGFGFDFDGVERLPEGINGIEDIDKIINALLKANYKEDDVKKIAGLNFVRVFNFIK